MVCRGKVQWVRFRGGEDALMYYLLVGSWPWGAGVHGEVAGMAAV